jgi:hypothetical protein
MPEKFNAARRVRNILANAKEQREDNQTLGMWAYIFDVRDQRHTQFGDTKFEIIRLLGLLNEQVESSPRWPSLVSLRPITM